MRRFFLAVICLVMLSFSVAQAKTCVTKEGALVGISEEFLERAVQFAVAKDEVAFNKLVAANVVLVLRAGVRLELEDYGFSISKVRVPGEVQSIWILSDLMNCR